MPIDPKPGATSGSDDVTLGEVMLRLSPPGHLESAPDRDVHVGSGEFDVASAPARVARHTGWVGGVLDKPLSGWSHAPAAEVDTNFAGVAPFDRSRRPVRMGLHVSEVGAGYSVSARIERR